MRNCKFGEEEQEGGGEGGKERACNLFAGVFARYTVCSTHSRDGGGEERGVNVEGQQLRV